MANSARSSTSSKAPTPLQPRKPSRRSQTSSENSTNSWPSEMKKVSYGIDAPRVVLNLGLFGFAALVIALLAPDFHIGKFIFPHKSFYYPAAFLLAEVALMLDYSVR